MPLPEPLTYRAADGASFSIFEHGAHITSWQPSPGDERLFLSAASEFRRDAAIRGGIPVIFPQFANRGPLPKHGFVRTAWWTLDPDHSGRDDAGAAVVAMRLRASPDSLGVWPHRFDITLRARALGGTLEVTLTVENLDDAPFSFTAALHTYLRVDDAQHTGLRGLLGNRYEDSMANGALATEVHDELTIAGELDRVYLDVKKPIDVVDEGRTTRVSSTGFRDAVIWNPGATRAAALRDMEPDGWRRMICVEAAAVGTPIDIGPGEHWSGTQRLDAVR